MQKIIVFILNKQKRIVSWNPYYDRNQITDHMLAFREDSMRESCLQSSLVSLYYPPKYTAYWGIRYKHHMYHLLLKPGNGINVCPVKTLIQTDMLGCL